MSHPKHEDPESLPLYRIGAVAKLTGISTHQLRIWERRYTTVEPARSAGGDRLYSDHDVARLRLLKQLSDAGHAIGSIARLPDEELNRLLTQYQQLDTASVDDGNLAEGATDSFLRAIERMDVIAAERVLSRGTVAFEPRDFTIRVLIPALHEIGRRWEYGEFTIAHEHAASAALRTQLGMLIRLYSSDPRAGTAVCATPAGELHEFGALAAALTTAARGWRVIYLGPNLPADDILETSVLSEANALLLSVILTSDQARSEIETIAAKLPSKTALIIGGRGAPALGPLPARVRIVSTLEELGALL